MTAQGIYDHTMSLIDERLDSGVIDPTTTAVFAKNAPFLLTILQDEVLLDSNLTKTYTITKSTVTDTDGNYKDYAMPNDFYKADQIVEIQTDGNYSFVSDFIWGDHATLLVPDSFTGTISVIYKPIPTAITSLSDTMVVDDIISRSVISYGLASLLLTNENRALANYFGQKYEEARSRIRNKNTAFGQSIKDVIDTTLSY